MARLFILALLAGAAMAQDDRVVVLHAEAVNGVSVQAFDVRELKYARGAETAAITADRVLAVELARAAEIYRRGLAAHDAELLRAAAREQLAAKNPLLAQAGFLAAGQLLVAAGRDEGAAAAYDELQRAVPDAGVLPQLLRLRVERGLRSNDQAGLLAAQAAVRRWQGDALAGAWAPGLRLEAELFAAMVARAQGGDAKSFQARLRDFAGRARSGSPELADRATALLADTMREAGDDEGAQRAYQQLVDDDGGDDDARAIAWIGLGLLSMQNGSTADRAPFRRALLQFLRVRLDTRNAADRLQAAALYHAITAATRWGGEDSRSVIARCRGLLLGDHADSEWARRVQRQ